MRQGLIYISLVSLFQEFYGVDFGVSSLAEAETGLWQSPYFV